MKLISKKQFVQIVGHEGFQAASLEEEVRDSWNSAVGISQEVIENFPKLGFFSPIRKRLDAFHQACDLYERRVAAGEIAFEATVLSVNILRLSSKDFRRAVNAFEARISKADGSDQDKMLAAPGGTFAWTYARMIQPDFGRNLPVSEEIPEKVPDEL